MQKRKWRCIAIKVSWAASFDRYLIDYIHHFTLFTKKMLNLLCAATRIIQLSYPILSWQELTVTATPNTPNVIGWSKSMYFNLLSRDVSGK